MLNEKKVDPMLKSLYLWLNCEAKLQELVHLPNRVEIQIHPLRRESGIVKNIKAGVKETGYVAVLVKFPS